MANRDRQEVIAQWLKDVKTEIAAGSGSDAAANVMMLCKRISEANGTSNINESLKSIRAVGIETYLKYIKY